MRLSLRSYLQAPLFIRILTGFISGTAAGGILWHIAPMRGESTAASLLAAFSSLGSAFPAMLGMILTPLIFCSALTGCAALPPAIFARNSLKFILYITICSILSGGAGLAAALIVNPACGADLVRWKSAMMTLKPAEISGMLSQTEVPGAFINFMFQNPLAAMTGNRVLPLLLFSILCGLALRTLMSNGESKKYGKKLSVLSDTLEAGRGLLEKILEWIMEYCPIGLFFLTMTNLALYGPGVASIFMPVLLAVFCCAAIMILLVYPLLLLVILRRNPYPVLGKIAVPVMTAIATGNSLAALPVSIKTAIEDLKIDWERAAFIMPLGVIFSFGGVFIYLPLFALLSVNLFGMETGITQTMLCAGAVMICSAASGGAPGTATAVLLAVFPLIGLTASQTGVMYVLVSGIIPFVEMAGAANSTAANMICACLSAAEKSGNT
jgi:Na+/H+-dicarboxylate symporter